MPVCRRVGVDQAPLQLTAEESELEALKVFADGPCEDTVVRYRLAD